MSPTTEMALKMPAKILFVDDEPDLETLICQKFRQKIRTGEYQVFFAHNGVEALSTLREQPDIDIILTDINMPVMDGMALLAKLNELVTLVKTVVISAYGDLGNIRKAMNGGAFDFLIKPINFQDLEITINKTLCHVQQLKDNERSRQEREEKLRQSEAREREKAIQLELALQNLQRTQSQLIQTEKMSSLGQLIAGIAHEINNPVNFIYGNLTYVADYTHQLLSLITLYQQHDADKYPEIEALIEQIELEFIKEDMPKMLSSMQLGAERIRQIVVTLRNFSRLDEAEMKPVNIHEGIDSSLVILQSQLKAKPNSSSIQVIKEYGDLPQIECYACQLNQVFMNLLSNAIYALNHYDKKLSPEPIKNEPRTITISTSLLNCESVRISFKDNGPGMTSDVINRLFNPFFTTKPLGDGTGLGLSISYQIVVEKHGGDLKCFSQPDRGAEFVIEIPIRQSERVEMKAS
ncbi:MULTISPECIES: ATP-binding protein [unclassified Microcoleus]|uniref:ATP-binding protein n=1 Tax=unclassified Microcoleus TaxID=2642155 RepID=UPI002FCEB482